MWKQVTCGKYGYVKEHDGKKYQYSVQLLNEETGVIVIGVGMTMKEAEEDAWNQSYSG